MIDWLYSKLTMLVASFLILATMVGLLSAVNGSLRDQQAGLIVQRIAGVLDSMSSVQGETTATITVATPGDRGTLPRTIAGERYFVQIYWDAVWMYRESRPDRPWRIAPLLHPVYTSPPPNGELTAGELSDLEAAARTVGVTIRPLAEIQVARMWVTAEGQQRYLTFAFS